MNNITRTNLEIDLREINYILETKPNIMASEYVELNLAKKEIIKRLIKREYPSDQPEPNKQYALTGKTGDKCIANGNTWKESEVKPKPKVCHSCGAPIVNGMCDSPLSRAD